MTVIVPTIELTGAGVIVEWVGLTPGDVGKEVEISAFESFVKRVVSSGDMNGLILQSAMLPGGPWLNADPSAAQSPFSDPPIVEGWFRPTVSGGTANTFTVTLLCRT